MFWIPVCLRLTLKPVGCTWGSGSVFPLRDGVQNQALRSHLTTTTTKPPPDSSGSYLLPENQGKASTFDNADKLKGPLSSFICPSLPIFPYGQSASGPGLKQVTLYGTAKSWQRKLKAAALPLWLSLKVVR